MTIDSRFAGDGGGDEGGRDLDRALAEARDAAAAPSDDLMARVLADAATTAAGRRPAPASAAIGAPAAKRRRLFGRRLFGPLVACAASAAIGVWLGASAPRTVTNSATEMLAIAGMQTIAGASFELAMLDEDDF